MSYIENLYMTVGVIQTKSLRDLHVSVRDLHVSHTLGCVGFIIRGKVRDTEYKL